jgi:hypothetical protein
MKFGWVALAEGIGADAKGSITLIGMNQNVFVTRSVPASTKRAIMAHMVEADLTPGATVTVSFNITSPSGQVLAAQTANVVTGDRQWKDLPATIDVPAEFVINTTEFGEHKITVELKLPDGGSLSEQVSVYVIEPPTA